MAIHDSFLLSPHINLPLPILLHALGLTLLGIYLVYSSPKHGPKPPSSNLGLATTGLGLAYLTTSYMNFKDNQFLHASGPVRVILGLLALLKYPWARQSERKGLLVVALYDGGGGLLLCYWLGRWNGQVAGL